MSSPSPVAISAQLQEIVAAQNEADRTMDMEDLRRIQREILATSSDAEIIQILQVQREDMPEAIKTLQRAFEQCLEHEHQLRDQAMKAYLKKDVDQDPSTSSAVNTKDSQTMVTKSTESSQSGPLSNLRRRFTLENQKNKDNKASKKSSMRVHHFEGTTLDKEFIESGIDALRRVSMGQDLTLPSWTITRYLVLCPRIRN
jgi:hypothetical protein